MLTGQDKEDHPVHDQDGPEDGNVEDFEPGAEERDGNSTSGPVPELELRKTADEGSELFVALGRQGTNAVLHVVLEVIVGGVELRLEEGKEQVEQVDTERIGDCGEERVSESQDTGTSSFWLRTDVPSLCDKDADEEENQSDASTDPAVHDIGRRLVKQSLVLLLRVSCRFGRARRIAGAGDAGRDALFEAWWCGR